MSSSERLRTRALRLGVACALALAGARELAAQAPPIPVDTLWVITERASSRFPATTRGFEVLGPEQLADAPARNLADVLTWALGIEVMARSTAHGQASIRGGTAEQVVILVDGARVSHGPSGPHAPDIDIPIDQIERIEILRGPASSALAGEAAAGVINVITRRDTDAGFSVNVEGGSFGGFDAGASARVGGQAAHLSVTASHHRSDGHRPGTDALVNQAGVLARIGGGRHVVRARVNASERRFGAAGFFAPYPEYDPHDDARSLEAALSWEASLSARWSFEPHALVQLHRDDYVLRRNDPDFYRNRHEGWLAAGGLNVLYRRDAALRIQGGVEYRREGMRTSNAAVPNARCTEEFRCEVTHSTASAFAETTLGESGRAAVTAGARAEWHARYGARLVPSLSVALWPADAMRLRASTGTSWRVPNFTERFYVDSANVGNPGLLPERGEGIELGADLLASPNLRIAFSGFMRRMYDLIDWIQPRPEEPDPGEPGEPEEPGEGAALAGEPGSEHVRWQATNIEEATFDGVEAELTVLDLLGARVAIKAMGVTFNAPGIDSIASRFAFRPMTRVITLAADRAIGDHLVLSGRVLNGRRRAEPHYTRLDARISLRAGGAHIYLDAINLNGARYLDVTGAPAPRHAFFLGASWGWSPD